MLKRLKLSLYRHLFKVPEKNFVAFANLTILSNLIFFTQTSSVRSTVYKYLNVIGAKYHVALSYQISNFIHVYT